ncbi:unnamed protein product [Rotaria magnacalcarata]
MMEFNLREVFSILDENHEGQIQLRRFVDVANNYYSDAEQLAGITKALDPKNTGFINFDQFCQGIAQISSLQGVSLKDVASDLTRLSRENSLVEDSDQRSLKTNNGFDFSLSNFIIEENQDGSTTTFNEYDVDSEDTSHLHNSSKPHSKTNIKNKTSIHIQSSSPNSQSISPRLDSAIFGDEEEFSGIAEPDSSNYLSDSITRPRPITPQRVSDILKKNNYLKPITPTEELEQRLQESVEELQKTVENLTVQKQTTTDRLSRIQSENTDLKKRRLLALEDRFQDIEGHQSRTTQSEQQKFVESINQIDRTFLQEKEILQSRISAIEAELKNTQTTNGQMKKDVTQLKQKLDDVDIQLRDSQVRCDDLSEDNEKLLEQLRLQRKQLEEEKLRNAQLAEQLTSESSRKIFAHTLSRTEDIIKTSEIRIQELDAQVHALKLENEKLLNENEELRERAVIDGIDEGRRLMNSHSSLSYAAELEVLSKDELMSKLRDQLMVNDRLRQYIERMLSVIIENSPQLLEVTMNAGANIVPMKPSTNHRIEPSNEIKTSSLPLEPVIEEPLPTPTPKKQTNDNS